MKRGVTQVSLKYTNEDDHDDIEFKSICHNRREIDYVTFVAHVDKADLKQLKKEMGYTHKEAYNHKRSLASDINVSFWRSYFAKNKTAYACMRKGKWWIFL